jgi:hypothetical protein
VCKVNFQQKILSHEPGIGKYTPSLTAIQNLERGATFPEAMPAFGKLVFGFDHRSQLRL